MQQRIDQLEALVKRLIARHQDGPSKNQAYTRDDPKSGSGSGMTAVATDASDWGGGPGRAGTTVINGVHSIYKGADDWYEVLPEVNKFQSPFFAFSPVILRHMKAFD